MVESFEEEKVRELEKIFIELSDSVKDEVKFFVNLRERYGRKYLCSQDRRLRKVLRETCKLDMKYRCLIGGKSHPNYEQFKMIVDNILEGIKKEVEIRGY